MKNDTKGTVRGQLAAVAHKNGDYYVSNYVKIYKSGADAYLCINMFDGSWQVISKKVAEYLNGNNDAELTESEVANLAEHKYIFDSAEAFADYVIGEYEKIRSEKRGTNEYRICPTFGCNLKCTYCYEHDLTDWKSKNMNSDDIDVVFEAIGKMAVERDEKNPGVQIFGGEPFLPNTKEAVEKILEESRKRGYKVSVTTNGVNIDGYIDVLKKYRETMNPLRITLDGPKEIHDIRRIYRNGNGTFDTIVKSIDTLLENNLPVKCRINLDRDNIAYLPKFAEFLEEKGWLNHSKFVCTVALVVNHQLTCDGDNLLDESEAGIQLIDMYCEYPSLRKLDYSPFRILNKVFSFFEEGVYKPNFYYCEANHGGGVVFGPDKLVYPCNEAVVNSRLAVGEFMPTFKLSYAVKQKWTDRSFLDLPKCTKCIWAPLCGGGCEHLRNEQYGNDFSKSGYSAQNGNSCEKEIEMIVRYAFQRLGNVVLEGSDK